MTRACVSVTEGLTLYESSSNVRDCSCTLDYALELDPPCTLHLYLTLTLTLTLALTLSLTQRIAASLKDIYV